MQIVRSGISMERIATYILGELPDTENGNKYTLVVQIISPNGQRPSQCEIWKLRPSLV
jgi:hypothetical protein